MKPKYTRPDANQGDIELELQQAGFLTYRTASCAIQKMKTIDASFHPLDLIVVGVNRRLDRVEITLWEIKTGIKEKLTRPEFKFLAFVAPFFAVTSEFNDFPINIAYSTEEILAWYGRLDNQDRI